MAFLAHKASQGRTSGRVEIRPVEIKVFVTAGLLLVIYWLVWIVQKAWTRLGARGSEL